MEEKYLTPGPVSEALISEHLMKMGEDLGSGASSVFLGRVRADKVDGRRVKCIEYSAYSEMVAVEADKILAAVRLQFEDVRSAVIVHSAGLVNAGEISLLVIISAGHRHHAIHACEKTVELIKANLPVWKKEIFEDNTHLWK